MSAYKPQFFWNIAHKFSIYAPPALGTAYVAILGIVGQANEGTPERAFFENQIVMWRSIVLSPYAVYWLLGLVGLWSLVVLWTGAKFSAREAFASNKSSAVHNLNEKSAGENFVDELPLFLEGSVIKSVSVQEGDGTEVDGLWCVGLFLCIYNQSKDSRTLRNVSAQLGFVLGPVPLSFESGERRLDIRKGERVLLQIGYILSSEPIGLPSAERVTLPRERIANAEEALRVNATSFVAGSPSLERRSGLNISEDDMQPLVLPLTFAVDDYEAITIQIVVDASWSGKAMQGAGLLRPYRAER